MLINGTRPESTEILEWFIAKYGREDISSPFNFSIYKELGSTGNTSYPQALADFVVKTDNVLDDNPIFATVWEDSDTMTDIETGSTYATRPGRIETCIYTGGDSHIIKSWLGVSTQCEPLTTGQSITLKYKADADTDWTTFATINTVGTISQETMNIESTGANLPNLEALS